MVSGIELAWMLGLQKVILKSDFKLVAQLITQVSITVETNYSLIVKAKELLDCEWEIKVQLVYREANQEANWLANKI